MHYWRSPVTLAACLVLSPSSAQAIAVPDMVQRMEWAADYLHAAIRPSGRFDYIRQQDLPGTEAEQARYNLLRHAGTLFALADYHAAVPPSAEQSDKLRRAARYLVDCCVGPVEQAPGALAAWSHPVVVGRPNMPLQAKLGGAGLTLVALLSVESVRPGVSAPATWRGLGEFLLFMQRSDGSFVSKYVPSRGGPDPAWVSLYYPGEAALGLVMLFEHDPDPRWLQAAIDALRYLARLREAESAPPADHWALIATARLLRQPLSALEAASPPALTWISAQGQARGLRDLLVAHGERVVDAMLAEQRELNGLPCLDGGFDAEGRIAPTATRLEGLLAALDFLPQGMRRDAVETAAARGLAFLAAGQIGHGPWRGGFPRVKPDCRSMSPRAGEIRIDYVQHALSALLEAHRRAAGH